MARRLGPEQIAELRAELEAESNVGAGRPRSSLRLVRTTT